MGESFTNQKRLTVPWTTAEYDRLLELKKKRVDLEAMALDLQRCTFDVEVTLRWLLHGNPRRDPIEQRLGSIGTRRAP